MAIDVIIAVKSFRFLTISRDGKKFSGQFICIVFRKSRIFYNRIYTNHSWTSNGKAV